MTTRPSTCKSGVRFGFGSVCIAADGIVLLPSMGFGVTTKIHLTGSVWINACAGVARTHSQLKSCNLWTCTRSLVMGLALCACFSRDVPPATTTDDHREPERTSHDSTATDEHRSPSERPSHVADAERSSHRSAVVPILRASSTSTRTWAARITSGVIPTSWLGLERLGYSNGINCTLERNRQWLERHVLRGWIILTAHRRLQRFYALLNELFGHRTPLRARALITDMVLEPWPRITPFVFRQYMYRD